MTANDQQPAVSLPDDALLKQCEVRRLRRSGPGGQHRNKVETAVQITHIRTGIQAEANERRSQPANQKEALKRLRFKLALNEAIPLIELQSFFELWSSRCQHGRISINANHADFPIILSLTVSLLHKAEFDLKPVAAELETTPSQLVKLLKIEPKALAFVNERRIDREMSPLK